MRFLLTVGFSLRTATPSFRPRATTPLSERANLTKQYAQQATAYLCALSTRAGFTPPHRLPLAEANGNYTFTPIHLYTN